MMAASSYEEIYKLVKETSGQEVAVTNLLGLSGWRRRRMLLLRSKAPVTNPPCSVHIGRAVQPLTEEPLLRFLLRLKLFGLSRRKRRKMLLLRSKLPLMKGALQRFLLRLKILRLLLVTGLILQRGLRLLLLRYPD